MSVVEWRASVARATLVTSGVASVIATATVIFNFSPGPRQIALGSAGVITTIAALIMVFRPPSVVMQARVGVAGLVVSGLTGVAGVGLMSGPGVLLTAAIVVAGLLLGRRAASAVIVLSAGVITIIGALAVSGVLAAPEPHEVSFAAARTWLRGGVLLLGLWLILGATVTSVVGWLERSIAHAQAEAALRAQADEKRRQAEHAAQDAHRRELVGRLAAAVAHDFNNAMVVIRLAAEALRRPDATREDIAEAAADIDAAASDASGLTRQLLVLGGRATRQPTALSLRTLVDRYRVTLARILPSDVTLQVEHADDAWVEADELQLHQVLLNLAVNARDALAATPRITLRTRVVTLAEAPARTHAEVASTVLAPGRYAVIEVEDNGAGMSAETRQRAFEPFFTTKASAGGTGLGLASVLAIAEQSGGGVVLDSEPGRGTRVALWLPAIAARSRTSTVPTPIPAPLVPRPATPLAGVTVLIVDDEPVVLRLQTRAFERAGARVLAADDGDAALGHIAALDTCDALCTDAIMPGAPVSDVIAAFQGRFPGAPVIVCSGHVEEMLVRRGIEGGRYTLVAKPFAADDVLHTVARMLREARGEAAPAAS